MTVQEAARATLRAEPSPSFAVRSVRDRGVRERLRRRGDWLLHGWTEFVSGFSAKLAGGRAARIAPVLWQLPIAMAFALATVLVFIMPSSAVTSQVRFVAGLALVLAATVLALVAARGPALTHFVVAIPLLDFLALGVLRSATGGAISIYSSLTLLPLVWVAMRRGRRNLLFVFIGVLVAVLLPTLADGRYERSPSELLRALFVASVYTLAGAVVHQVSEQARRRYALLKAGDASRVRDLNRGAAAQQALLPGNLASIGGYSVAGVCLPAKAVGGDFYDWYTVPGGVAVTLGDVMGKGVGAGIIAATTRAVLRSARLVGDPVVALERADDCLSNELSDMTPFATLFHARIDEGTGLVRYVDAGHGLAFLVRADGHSQRLPSGDLPLGLGLTGEWAPSTLTLGPGDALVALSDGVHELYGGTDASLARLAAVLAGSASSAAGMVDAVIAQGDGDNPLDDLTVLVIRRD